MKNKILKKILGIMGYKLIEKKLFKNDRLISTKSYLTLNRLLKNLFEEKKINFLIQIGANDGSRFDILNNYIKTYKIKSLLVEPIKEIFEKLKKNYEDCNFVSFENSAISVNNEITYLYKVDPKYLDNYDDHIPGITSFEKKHLLNHDVKKSHIVTEKINSVSMENLIAKYNIDNFDLLCVDTEGYDGNIVNDFLKNILIRPIIILEYIHINNDTFKTLINNLEQKKYNFFSIDENLICFPEKDIKYIKFN